tara:strand:+ start:173 stop:1183 length:1011 start_codon:yes stop_codon:yes gene_type:complete
MAKAGDFYVGSQLFCGTAEYEGVPLPPVGLGVGPTKIRGAGYIAGPLLIGNPFSFTSAPNINEANVMIGRNSNAECKPPPPSILKISSRGTIPTPIDVVIGDVLGPVGIAGHALTINMLVDTITTLTCPKTFIIGIINAIGFKVMTGAEIRAAIKAETGAHVQAGAKVRNGVEVTNGIKITNALNSAPISKSPVHIGKSTGNKSFDIPHARKKGKRIRHVCAEGPEAGIYIRGRLKGGNMIELPEYWDGLVDPETITVSLTQIGSSQDLMVDKIEWGKKVYIRSGNASAIDCFYEIWVARLINPEDLDEKLHVVYDGETPADYPGNNDNYIIGGYQ